MKNQGSSSTTCLKCSLPKQGSEEHDIALPLYLVSLYLIRKPAERSFTSKKNITDAHSPLCSPPFSKPVFPLLMAYSMLFLPFISAPLYRTPLCSVHSSIPQGPYTRKLLIEVTRFSINFVSQSAWTIHYPAALSLLYWLETWIVFLKICDLYHVVNICNF